MCHCMDLSFEMNETMNQKKERLKKKSCCDTTNNKKKINCEI